MTTETTITNESTVETIASEFVKQHNATEIVAELVSKEQSIQRLQENLDYSRSIVGERNAKLAIVKAFIKSHVIDDDDATVSELKDLAGELDITLTKEVRVTFTVEYDLTVECDIDEGEIDENDFRVDLTYNGVGELTNESADWQDFSVEEED